MLKKCNNREKRVKNLPIFKLINSINFKKIIFPLSFLILIFFVFIKINKVIKSFSSVKIFDGRINFVFLGMAGEVQKTSDLTDTIVFVSYNVKNGRTLIFSLPRDIWFEEYKTKINALYHYGGFNLVEEGIKLVTGQPVSYIFLIDFEGFKKIVDFLGGVDIYVQKTFDDYKYPIPGKENDLCGNDPEFKCRYEHIHFEQGWETMDGERALKYVRSRNAQGEEGTDFARNQRQQIFLQALKNKIFSPKIFLNPSKIIGLVELFSSTVKTNLTTQEYFDLIKNFLRFNPEGIKLGLIDWEKGPFVFHPKFHYSRQWVLLPTGENWGKFQNFVKENLP